MLTELQKLKRIIEESPRVQINDYSYLAVPFTNGINLEPEIMEIVAAELLKISSGNFDKIICPFSHSIPYATVMSLKAKKPLVIASPLKLGLPGEITVSYKTRLTDRIMHINGVKPKESVLVFDDVVSTGATLTALVNTLKKASVNVKELIVIIDKNNGSAKVKENTGYTLKSLLKVYINGNKVRAIL